MKGNGHESRDERIFLRITKNYYLISIEISVETYMNYCKLLLEILWISVEIWLK